MMHDGLMAWTPRPILLSAAALPCKRNPVWSSRIMLGRGSVMVSDEALNTLLDQLAALDRREDRLAILRT